MIALALTLLGAAAAGKSLPPAPIDFGAATMTLEPKANTTHLEGAVWFDRKDVKVTGDRAKAEFSEVKPADRPAPRPRKKGQRAPKVEAAPGEKGQTLSRFVIEGAVHVEKPGAQSRTADGNHATYDAANKTLMLLGPPAIPPPGLQAVTGPVLRDGPELMLGDRVLLHLDTDEVEVLRPRILLRRSLPGAPAAKDGKAELPVRVEAGLLRLDQQRKLARFREKVVIHRGDLTVKGPRMDARYDDAGQLTTLQIRGGVVMVDGDRRATGQTADYDAATRMLVLTGDPKLFDRGDVLRGNRIQMQLDSREVKVERASGRVRPEQHKDEGGILGKPAAAGGAK